MSACRCINTVNEQLKNQGVELDAAITLNTETLDFEQVTTRVALVKLDPSSRKKIVPLRANYCPFCGVKYEVTR